MIKHPVAVTVCCIVSIFFYSSCQKEVSFEDRPGPANDKRITGNYDFVGMKVAVTSSALFSFGGTTGKGVTSSTFITKNNTGTVQITAGQLIINNMSYVIDTTVVTRNYINNTLVSEDIDNHYEAVPAYNETINYTRNNPDSITVANEGFVDIDPSQPFRITGYRLHWAGDTLKLTLKDTFDQVDNSQGFPLKLSGVLNGVISLKKK